jgi:protein SCO1/2
MKKITFALLALVLLALVGCGKEKLPVVKKAPAFALTNLDGSTVTLENTNGKVRLLYFYYSSCGEVCLPTNLINAKIQTQLKKNGVFADKTLLLSISIDLKVDSQKQLTDYAGRLGADTQGWYFLRAKSFPEVQALAKDYGVAVTALEDGEFIHTNALILIDKKGNIRKIYTSDDIKSSKVKAIAADMTALAKE